MYTLSYNTLVYLHNDLPSLAIILASKLKRSTKSTLSKRPLSMIPNIIQLVNLCYSCSSSLLFTIVLVWWFSVRRLNAVLSWFQFGCGIVHARALHQRIWCLYCSSTAMRLMVS